ncbi:hypothetical protein LDENG_00085380 [Lucifuga dentata]|nr:hypothetical protein LDENG_00085380 [Lucifuga dentata]
MSAPESSTCRLTPSCSLKAPTVPPESPPSHTSPQSVAETEAQGNSSFSTKPSATEEKTNQQAPTSLTDTKVVIIVSVSLALLVCVIIPLIFYGHWRSNKESHNRADTSKNKDAVGLQ